MKDATQVIGSVILASFLPVVLWMCVGFAYGRDNGQWAQTDPDIRDFVRGLKSKNGVPCCDTADGEEVEMWETQNDHYRIRVKGQWIDVPPEAVLDIPNKLGYARAWVYLEGGVTKVRCFLVGPLI